MIKHRIDDDIWCPDADDLARVHDKFAFIEMARDLGLSIPDTTLIAAKSDLTALAGCASELVFKPQWSRFATDILIKPTTKQLSQITPTKKLPWVAQTFVIGDEISTYALAQDGKLLALAQYQSLCRRHQVDRSNLV